VVYSNDKLITHLGYGSVSNLLVADLKYRIRKGFRFQGGINRYLDDGMYGSRRARIDAELVDNHAIIGLPFLAAVNFRSSTGYQQDNPQLLNQSPQYKALFTGTNSTVMNKAFVAQEQITVNTLPLVSAGDSNYGFKGYFYGGVAGRAYSSGQANALAQAGPVLDFYLGRLRLQTGYTQSKVGGTDPFIFDQFIQGQQSVTAQGDVKICKFLTLGGAVGYNMNKAQYYSKTITAAIGPPDCRLLVSESIIQGTYRVGFDILSGQPVKFNNLVIKANPDQGQLGGI
jgi:hypothetical protein